MSDFGDIIYPIQDSAVKKEILTDIKRMVCEETGLSEGEVKVEIDQDGAIHAICRPHAKANHIFFEVSLE